MKRFFGKQYTMQPSHGNENTNDPPMPSSSQRRSIKHRTKPEIESTSSSQYQRICDNKRHISDGKRETKSRWVLVHYTLHLACHKFIYHKISLNPKVKRIIDNTGWCGIFRHEMPNYDRSVVEACVFRWWDTTHTFQLPKCEIGITPFDFTMLTGTHNLLCAYCLIHLFVIFYYFIIYFHIIYNVKFYYFRNLHWGTFTTTTTVFRWWA